MYKNSNYLSRKDTLANGSLDSNHKDTMILSVRVQVGKLLGIAEPLEIISRSVGEEISSWWSSFVLEIAKIGLSWVESICNHGITAPSTNRVFISACVWGCSGSALVTSDHGLCLVERPDEIGHHLVQARVIWFAPTTDFSNLNFSFSFDVFIGIITFFLKDLFNYISWCTNTETT